MKDSYVNLTRPSETETRIAKKAIGIVDLLDPSVVLAMALANRLPMIIGAVVMLMFPLASSQASVIYTLIGTGTEFDTATGTVPAEPLAFQLTLAGFANPTMNGAAEFFSCNQLDSSTNCDAGVFFSNQGVLGAFSSQVQFDATNNVGYDFFFPTGALVASGVYIAEAPSYPFNSGSLTVTQTPEPTTLLLALSGSLLYLRWRVARAASFLSLAASQRGVVRGRKWS